MAFADSWVETDPDGAVITVSLLDDSDRLIKRAMRERLEGDPADPDLTGLIEVASWPAAPKPRKGAARVYVDTQANILAFGATKREDGRLAVSSDTRKLYHVATAGVVSVQVDVSDVIGGAALTKVDDTNVTLTLGGTPATALVRAASLTLGWAGTLAAGRLNANVVQGIVNDTNVTGVIAAQTLTIGWAGTLAAGRLNANVVQGIVNDANVTGVIAAQTLTFGWAGRLALSRFATGGANLALVGNGGADASYQAIANSVAGRTGAVVLTAADIGAGTFPAGTFTMTGNLIVGTAVASYRSITINSNAGFGRQLVGTTAGVMRWYLDMASSAAEGGGNAGSDLAIARYNDAGVYISTPFAITRSTGLTAIANGLTVSAGNVGIGVAPATDRALYVAGAGLTGVTQRAIQVSQTFSSAATTYGVGLLVGPQTAAAAFVMASGFGVYVDDWTKGAGSTITTQYGVYVANQTKGGTNYAIYTGTASARFGDVVLVGGTSGLRDDLALMVVAPTTPMTNLSQKGILVDIIGTVAGTTGVAGVWTRARSATAAYVTGFLAGLYVVSGSAGAGSTVTTNYGIYIENQSAGATNYAIYTGAGAVRFGDVLSVGSASLGSGAALIVAGTITSLGGINQSGVYSNPTMTSAATGSGVAVYGQITTAAAVFAMSWGAALYAGDATKGAGSTIGTQYGLYVASQTQGGTNYAIFTNTGVVKLGDTTDASSTVTGGLQTLGGAAITKKLYVGTGVYTPYVDTIAAADLLLKRNGTTIITAGAATITLGVNTLTNGNADFIIQRNGVAAVTLGAATITLGMSTLTNGNADFLLQRNGSTIITLGAATLTLGVNTLTNGNADFLIQRNGTTILTLGATVLTLGVNAITNGNADLVLQRNGSTIVTYGASTVTYSAGLQYYMPGTAGAGLWSYINGAAAGGSHGRFGFMGGGSAEMTVNAAIDSLGSWNRDAVGTESSAFTVTSANFAFLHCAAGANPIAWTTLMLVGHGVQVGSPTGGDKGTGSINLALDLYKNNSAYTNPDFVLELWATGRIEKYAYRTRAPGYKLMNLDEVEAYARKHYRLPFISDDPAGVFDMTDIALEKIEELFIHAIDHEKRIRKLEEKLAA